MYLFDRVEVGKDFGTRVADTAVGGSLVTMEGWRLPVWNWYDPWRDERLLEDSE